jgi:hypothetical protein
MQCWLEILTEGDYLCYVNMEDIYIYIYIYIY